MTQHGHVTEGCTETAIRTRFDEDKLDDQHLQACLDQHQHCDHEFFRCWHFQLKQVLQDVDHLSHCRVEEEDPGQQSHVYTAQQDADDVGRHRVSIQADDGSRLGRDAQTPKYQP